MSVRPPLHLSLTTIYTLDLTRWRLRGALTPNATSWHGADPSIVAFTHDQPSACLLRQIAAYEGTDPEHLSARYRRGSHCSAMTRDGAVLSYCWVSTGRERIGESECDLEVPPGMAYIWDCATLPPYRGRGLYPALLQQIADGLRRTGIHRVWVAASWTNLASRRGIEKAGFEHVATIVHLCLGPWRTHRVVGTLTASPELTQLTCQITRMPEDGVNVASTTTESPMATLSGDERRHRRD